MRPKNLASIDRRTNLNVVIHQIKILSSQFRPFEWNRPLLIFIEEKNVFFFNSIGDKFFLCKTQDAFSTSKETKKKRKTETTPFNSSNNNNNKIIINGIILIFILFSICPEDSFTLYFCKSFFHLLVDFKVNILFER